MKKENFLLSVRNSIGSQLFRSYLDKEGSDVLKDGDLSCAYYMSSIMLLHGLIDRVHFTVPGTIEAMESNGWYKIQTLKVGCVVVWGSVHQNGADHKHLGVYVGEGQAISNRSSLGMPGEHALHYSGLDKDGTKKKAPILNMYWHSAFNKVE
jgi:hypothetical protein